MISSADAIFGSLLGLAVGDALGLPRERLSAARAARLWPGTELKHDLIFGRGMVSDDTDHACLTAQALLRCPLKNLDPKTLAAFGHSLQWKLKWWLASLPAGTGMATAKALIKGWFGFGPTTAGVFSAGNGPAMRAPILGVCLAKTPDVLREAVRISTRITHTDPKAERGALWVAFATKYGFENGAAGIDPKVFLDESKKLLNQTPSGIDADLSKMMDEMQAGLVAGTTLSELAKQWGLTYGVSGYMYHTVPIVIYAWLLSPGDFRKVVSDVIKLGGDVDTTGAIAGGICGATVGVQGIPKEWIDGVCEYPRSVDWMRRAATRLDQTYFGAETATPGPEPLFWPLLPVRNIFFLLIVLKHGFRRLLPPFA